MKPLSYIHPDLLENLFCIVIPQKHTHVVLFGKYRMANLG